MMYAGLHLGTLWLGFELMIFCLKFCQFFGFALKLRQKLISKFECCRGECYAH
jgi:hypothetical protein